MRLLRLELTNFQGIRFLTLDFPDGCSASIYGDNAAGKTTVFNAVTWLLFGKASNGAKNFTPKTIGQTGETHNLEHSVTATFVMDFGQTVTLGRVFNEVYKRKRGSATAEFSGHETRYFVNGVPVKEKEYTDHILSYCGDSIETAMMLTMPDYFPSVMPWEARRAALLQVCGDVSDDDVIASTPDLSALREFLEYPGGSYSVAEYRKIAAARMKEANRELEAIPARIDEVRRSIPESCDLDEATIAANIEAGRNAVAALEDELATAKDDRRILRNEAQIIKCEAAIAEARANYRTEAANAERVRLDELRAAHDEVARLGSELFNLNSLIRNDCARLAETEKLLAERRAQRGEVDARTWEASDICPICGQVMPEEMLRNAASEFAVNKNDDIKDLDELIASIEGELDGLREVVLADKEKIAQTEALLEPAKARMEELKAQPSAAPTFEQTEEYKELTADLEAVLRKDSQAGEEADARIEHLERTLTEAKGVLTLEEKKLYRINAANNAKARIAELEAREKELAKAYEREAYGVYLCEEFTRAKVSMLAESINSKFEQVRFKLFAEQINGGVKECCEVLIPAPDGSLIPYQTANNAAKITAGLEIIASLSRSYGVSLPVFVDNAESITRLAPEKNMQIIRLVVSAGDKKLRLVTEDFLND